MPTRSALTRVAAILAVSLTLAACNAAERDADAVEKAATSAPDAAASDSLTPAWLISATLPARPYLPSLKREPPKDSV